MYSPRQTSPITITIHEERHSVIISSIFLHLSAIYAYWLFQRFSRHHYFVWYCSCCPLPIGAIVIFGHTVGVSVFMGEIILTRGLGTLGVVR